jgi:hypothetical protein
VHRPIVAGHPMALPPHNHWGHGVHYGMHGHFAPSGAWISDSDDPAYYDDEPIAGDPDDSDYDVPTYGNVPTPNNYYEEGSYISVAAGINGHSTRTGVGSAKGSTAAEADANALQQCGLNIDISYCQIVGRAWNGGCAYITSGNHPGGVNWGSSATIAGAINQCYRWGGTWCNSNPIGGCTSASE